MDAYVLSISSLDVFMKSAMVLPSKIQALSPASTGGINEAFDIAGEAAEYFMHGKNDWLLVHKFSKKMVPCAI